MRLPPQVELFRTLWFLKILIFPHFWWKRAEEEKFKCRKHSDLMLEVTPNISTERRIGWIGFWIEEFTSGHPVAQNHFVEGCENFVLRFSADFLECVFLICSKTTSIFLDYLWLKVSPESLKSYSKHRINKVFLIRLWISQCLKITLKFPDFRGKNWTQKYARIFFFIREKITF